jgi:hypothetical protein
VKKNRSGAKSKLSIDEAEVIKRRFMNDPLKTAIKPVKLDKYGKNHKNEPSYMKKRHRSKTQLGEV